MRFIHFSLCIHSSITSYKFDGAGMVFRIDSFKYFSCMRILRRSFAYLVMVSNNFQLNWPSWFNVRNQMVSGVWDLDLWFSFLMFIFHFLAYFLLIAATSEWEGITWRRWTDSASLLVWDSLGRHRFLCLMSSFVWAIFLKNLHFHLDYPPSYFSPSLRKIFYKGSLKLGSSVPSGVNIERERRDLGKRP